MSKFSRINTRKERELMKPHMKEIKRLRHQIRAKSLEQWASEAVSGCTIPRPYSKSNRRVRQPLYFQAKAWRWNEDRNPILPLIGGQNFTELTLDVDIDLIDRIAISVSRANVCYGKDVRVISMPKTTFTKLGQMVICAPETQKGMCNFAYGFDGLSIEDFKRLMNDLGITIIVFSQDFFKLPPEFPKIEDIEKYENYAFGKCLLV